MPETEGKELVKVPFCGVTPETERMDIVRVAVSMEGKDIVIEGSGNKAFWSRLLQNGSTEGFINDVCENIKSYLLDASKDIQAELESVEAA